MNLLDRLKRLESNAAALMAPDIEVVYRVRDTPDHLLREATDDELASLRVLAVANANGTITPAELDEYAAMHGALSRRAGGFPAEGGAS